MTPVSGERRLLEQPVFHDAEGVEEPRWSFVYEDVAAGRLELHEPLLAVETRGPSGEWAPLSVEGRGIDDQGTDLQIRWLGNRDAGMAAYEVRWFNPPAGTGQYRVRVAPRSGFDAFLSPVFGSGS